MGRSGDESVSGDLSNKDIMKFLKEMNGRLKKIEDQNTAILEDNKQIRKELDEVKENYTKVNEEVVYLKSELNILKQQKLAGDIIITGIPDFKDENLLQLLNKVLRVYGLAIKDTDIHSIYRYKNQTGVSPIQVAFKDRAAKEAIFGKQKEKGPVFVHQINSSVPTTDKRRIIFKDKLTPENYNLLKEARKFKEEYNFKYIWVRNSEQIVLREAEKERAIVVNSIADIKKLQQLRSASTSTEVIEING